MRTRVLPTMAAAIAVGITIGVAWSASAAPQCSSTADDAPNVARCAVATADSENESTEQTAMKAVDGTIDGYPSDFTAEWATLGGLDESSLTLTWTSPHQLGRIVLHDRPNLDDNVTAATIEFSDGSTVMVPALPNDGEPLTIEFSGRDTTSLRFTVDGVRPTTYNIGLSELEAFRPQRVAALLGVARTFADSGSAVRVLPRTVATVSEADDVRLLRFEIDVTAVAGTAEAGESDFVVLDAAGNRYSPVFDAVDDLADPLGDASFHQGETISGTVHFEVPARTEGLVLAYVPVTDGDPLATWTLNAP